MQPWEHETGTADRACSEINSREGEIASRRGEVKLRARQPHVIRLNLIREEAAARKLRCGSFSFPSSGWRNLARPLQ